MKKVGLAVVTYKDNFGSALQTYATQRTVQELGYDTRIFDISSVNKSIKKKKINFYLRRMLERDERKYVISSVISNLKKDKKNDEYARNMEIRHEVYKKFNKTYLNFFEKVNGWEALTAQSKECDAVLVGSDQLWRPSNIAGGFFTLEFVPDSVKKVAYATSFGVSVLPKFQHNVSSKYLERMNAISVRENTGSQIIYELTAKKVPVVCDPTMLFDAEQWMEIQEKKPLVSEKYILCYFLGDSEEYREFASRLKKETGYMLVALLHGSTYIASDENFADYAPYDVGPGEFINLIRNAEYICTDSFHGTVFSILNQKKFFTFRRFNEDSNFSTNDRLNTLFGWTNLKDRMLNGNEKVQDVISREIDYENVMKRIELKRQESLLFLRNSLKL